MTNLLYLIVNHKNIITEIKIYHLNIKYISCFERRCQKKGVGGDWYGYGKKESVIKGEYPRARA